MKDWNLSDQEGIYYNEDNEEEANCYFENDVKEFIKRLSIKLNDNSVSPRQAQILVEELGKLAGDKLI